MANPESPPGVLVGTLAKHGTFCRREPFPSAEGGAPRPPPSVATAGMPSGVRASCTYPVVVVFMLGSPPWNRVSGCEPRAFACFSLHGHAAACGGERAGLGAALVRAAFTPTPQHEREADSHGDSIHEARRARPLTE